MRLQTTLRRRLPCVLLLLFIAVLGLGIRAQRAYLPRFFADYAPDALWALLVFVFIVSCAPNLPTRKAAAVALSFSFLIEFSQMYQAPWINQLRATTFGGLILGRGFLWSDLLCYTAGIALAVFIDRALSTRQPHAAP